MKRKTLQIVIILVILLNTLPVISQNLRIYRPLKFELSGVKDGISVKQATKNFDVSIFDDGRVRFEVKLDEICALLYS